MTAIDFNLGDINGNFPASGSDISALLAYDMYPAGSSMDFVSIAYLQSDGTLVDCPYSCPTTAGDYYYIFSTLVSAGYTLEQAYSSLLSTNLAMQSLLSNTSAMVNGAHSRPMSRRVAKGEKTFWTAGDLANDNHDARDGSSALAEIGGGYNFGLAQLNVSLGKTRASQNLAFDGDMQLHGTYLMAEGIIPVMEDKGVYATIGAYRHWGDTDIRRGYLDGTTQEHSSARPDSRTWGVRARVDWENAFTYNTARFSPYADLWHSKTSLDGYTETDGAYPARFDKRTDRTTELRAGLNAAMPIKTSGFEFVANIEGVHRFDSRASATSGEVVGLFSFSLAGQEYDQNWLKGGVGVEGQLGKGKASVMLNGTNKGEMPSSWLAASYQMSF